LGDRKVLLADLSMLFAALCWGSGFAFTHWLMDHFGPLWLLALRFLLSSVLVLPLLRGDGSRGRTLIFGLGLGLMLALIFLVQVASLELTTPGRQSFLVGTNVMMVPVLYWLIYRKAPSFCSWLGATLALAGIWVMSQGEGIGMGPGEVLSLLLALLVALHVLAVGALSRREDPRALASWQLVFASALLLPLAALSSWPPRFPQSILHWLGLLHLSLLVTVVPFLVQFWAQRISPETHAAVIFSAESPFGYLFSLAMGREAFSWSVLAGGASIFLGVLLVQLEGLRRRP